MSYCTRVVTCCYIGMLSSQNDDKYLFRAASARRYDDLPIYLIVSASQGYIKFNCLIDESKVETGYAIVGE